VTSYLQNLNGHLAAKVACLPADLRARTAAYLQARQNADGGFPGRDGESDLYYTGFGLRGLAALDALTPDVGTRAIAYLRGCLSRQTSVVDFFSFLYACLLLQASGCGDVLADSPPDWPDRVAAMLDSFRTDDGGYNKNQGAKSASTYHTFLVGLCYELLGQSFPRPEDVLALARSRKRDDGGFVEISAMRRSGTNPTAAGIGILQLVQGPQLSADEAKPTIEFLCEMKSMDGGLRANDRIPLADLLSTFTGLWTLEQLGGLERIDRSNMYKYAAANEVPGGGFKAGIWDEVADVEYTFYGLGTMALCR
jgi:geranylgeranyl transferase type-2 subunit beta